MGCGRLGEKIIGGMGSGKGCLVPHEAQRYARLLIEVRADGFAAGGSSATTVASGPRRNFLRTNCTCIWIESDLEELQVIAGT